VAAWRSNANLAGTKGSYPQIFVARSTENGATWTAPAPLDTSTAVDSCFDGPPQIRSDDAGNWLAVWHSYGRAGARTGTDADIFIARSTDNGATWTTPTSLNTNAATDSAEDVHPRLTTDRSRN
jgi:Neuraminidase (sialidase)